MRVNSDTVLENGTKVAIGNHLGTVVGHETVQANPCGTVVVHTILCNKVLTRQGCFGSHVRNTDCKPIVIRPNYSFIETL